MRCRAGRAGSRVRSLHDVRVEDGGVVAVDDLSFDVAEGTIVGLIGPNGAGKATLLDAISGFAPALGSIRLAGQELGRLVPHRRIRAGLGRTFQQIELYDDLSVRENVSVGLAGSVGNGPRTQTSSVSCTCSTSTRSRNVLPVSCRRVGVSWSPLRAGWSATLVSSSSTNPPAASTPSRASGSASASAASATAASPSSLVDHDMHLVLNLCEQIHVLDFGRLIASGTPAVVKADRRVAEAYLGSTHAEQTAVTA